jgi:LPS-assembly protein
VQLLWSPGGTELLPNEDSRLVEFDEGNLFSLSRFPGADAVERGTRLNLGVSYTRTAAEGWVLGATLGRVIRTSDPQQFSAASGLDGKTSDWLASVSLGLPGGFGLAQRMVVGDGLSLTKSETRVSLEGDGFGLSGSYLWIVDDPDEDRLAPISELLLNGSYEVSDGWTVLGETRYDFEANRAARAGLGLQFRNECVSVDVSLSRRFTSSTSVTPTTDFGLSVDLVGFGSGKAAGPARTCRR